MKVIKWLDKHLEEVFLVLILVAIVLVMLYQIIRRYVFNSSLTWSEEFCRYAFTWFIFIAYSYSIRLGSELRVDAVDLHARVARDRAEDEFAVFLVDAEQNQHVRAPFARVFIRKAAAFPGVLIVIVIE